MQSFERLVQHPAYKPLSRFFSVATGIFLVVLTVLLISKSPLARSIWPWSYTTLSELSYFFLASITIAIAAPIIWIGLSGELAAAGGGAIDLCLSFAGSGIFMLQSYAINQNPRLITGFIFCAVMCASMVVVYLATRRLTYVDQRPLPRPIYYSFAFFVVALTIAGGLLVLKQPVFPWRLSGEASIIYGWIFLGAATFFAYSLYRPYWSNAAGNLQGFLAYDLVLIVPFVQRFADVEPQYRLSLVIYTSVVIFSGVLAIYYLFINRETRWRLR
jgi:hypothetical protein